MKKCKYCEAEIPPQRLKILPNTVSCVKCSDVGRKKGIMIQHGEGDHTYNEIQIYSENEYNAIQQEEKNSTIIFEKLPELVEMNDLDNENIQPNLSEMTWDNDSENLPYEDNEENEEEFIPWGIKQKEEDPDLENL